MCVLRVKGKHFDPRAWIQQTELDVICINGPGEPMFDHWAAKGRPRQQGFHADVSRKPWTDWEGQVEDAIAFLTEHRDELRLLSGQAEVESVHIDFPVEARPDAHVQHRIVTLPVELSRAAAEAGVEVRVTVYVASEEGEDADA